MGFLQTVSSIAAPARMRAESFRTGGVPGNPFWYTPEGFLAGGAGGSPDHALTLSHVYCAVSTISDDFGTMTCQIFEDLGADGRRRVQYGDPGIGSLAQKLRWYPNTWQTAKAFWSTLAWQYLMRPAAYAEIVYRPGLDGFVDQIIPRHPDRVCQERLPSGAIRFRLMEPGGAPRYITDDEMFCVRNTSPDGLNALGRLDYGSQSVSAALALQDYTKHFFRKGATAALLASYKGASMEDEEEAALHASIMRYVSGPENAGGVLLVPEDIDVKALGIDPDKAQLLGLKNISGRDVARMFKMPPSWLGIEGASSYSSQVQDATNYANRCQVPMVVEFEQAIQRDLIVVATKYFAKFNMDYLLRADTLARMQAYEVAIRSRIMRPSEARVKEDMSPDPRLDQLSEGDFRPGSPRGQDSGQTQSRRGEDGSGGTSARAQLAAFDRSAFGQLRGMLAIHDNAVRCLRRERAAVEKLAKKHASDVDGWQAGLRDFYEDHARFVSQTMRVNMPAARGYAAKHGSLFADNGMAMIAGADGESWERCEADALCALALDFPDGVAA